MRAANRTKEPDALIHELNWWWSEGFYCGFNRRLSDKAEDSALSGARRDQFYHGLSAGRSQRTTQEELEKWHASHPPRSAPATQ